MLLVYWVGLPCGEIRQIAMGVSLVRDEAIANQMYHIKAGDTDG
ncbi:hypothetical protein NIES4074_00090 [Cylindrospermum sp. NIES-4074]|nr:hypothetical protein NIES4074_00090 [Cylindrospermum sp. NIES-4074]